MTPEQKKFVENCKKDWRYSTRWSVVNINKLIAIIDQQEKELERYQSGQTIVDLTEELERVKSQRDDLMDEISGNYSWCPSDVQGIWKKYQVEIEKEQGK